MPILNREYLARMEEGLAVYEKPLSERKSVVCVDEAAALEVVRLRRF